MLHLSFINLQYSIIHCLLYAFTPFYKTLGASFRPHCFVCCRGRGQKCTVSVKDKDVHSTYLPSVKQQSPRWKSYLAKNKGFRNVQSSLSKFSNKIISDAFVFFLISKSLAWNKSWEHFFNFPQMCFTWLDKNLRLSDVFQKYYSTWKVALGTSRQPMLYVLADQSFRKSTATLCFNWLKTSVSGKHVDVSLALRYYLYQWPSGCAQIQSNLCLHNQWFFTYESIKVLFCIVNTIVKSYDICSPKNWSSDNRKKCHLQQHLSSWNTHIL